MVVPCVLLGTFPLNDRVVDLKGLLVAPWVVAAAVVLGHWELLNTESIKPEVVLGGQSPDEDQEKLPGHALLGEDHLPCWSTARLWCYPSVRKPPVRGGQKPLSSQTAFQVVSTSSLAFLSCCTPGLPEPPGNAIGEQPVLCAGCL